VRVPRPTLKDRLAAIKSSVYSFIPVSLMFLAFPFPFFRPCSLSYRYNRKKREVIKRETLRKVPLK
jgi:hypothetical protein